MKNAILFLILVCTVRASNAQFTHASLQASGLTCAICSKAVDNALRQLPFVQTVKPQLSNSAFELTFKPGMTADADALKDAVEKAGFFIARLSMTGSFDHVAVKNDAMVTIGGKAYHFLDVREQVLNGEQTLVLVDKAFTSRSNFKKYTASTNMQCIKTGKSAACCERAGLPGGTRIFHVTI